MAQVLLFNTLKGMRIDIATLNKNYLYMCLIVCGFLLISAREKHDIQYVNTINDFKTHTNNHIQNVTRLGMYLYHQHKHTYFKDIPEHIVREKLLYHDFEKVAHLEALQQFGYTNERNFSERLYDLYGRSIGNTNFKAKALIQELNEYADKFESELLAKHNLIDQSPRSLSVIEKIQRIERVADLVERQMNPVSPEEFGVREMRSATLFLNSQLEMQMARELTRAYHQIVRPNPLIYVVKSSVLTKTLPRGACSSLFN